MKTTFVKSSLSIILSFVLAVSIFVQPVCAISDDDSRIYSEIEAVLLRIAPEKESYGLGGVDFSSLSIGQDIPAYEVVDDELRPVSMRFFPILNEESIPVALATVACVDNQIAISISRDFVDTLHSLGDNDSISLIYDNEGVNLLKNGYLTNLCKNPVNAEFERNSISALSEESLLCVNQTTLSPVAAISSEPPLQTIGYEDDQIYLQVPIVLQSDNTTCWAAGAVCILRYKGCVNDDFTDLDFKKKFNSEDWTLNNVIKFMNSNYLWYRLSNYKYEANPAAPNAYENVWASLGHDNPVYGHFKYSTSGAHIMVIRGIYDNALFSVMDPLSNYYKSGTIITRDENNIYLDKKDFKFVFPDPAAATTLTLRYYGYRV